MPRWLGLLGMVVLSCACAWFSFRYTRFNAGVSSVWVANGLLVGVMTLARRRNWRWWMAASALGQLVARLLHDDGALMAIGLTTANLVESAIVVAWVRRDVDDLSQSPSLTGVARDALLSTVVACAISAALAWPIILLREHVEPLTSVLTWFTAHLLGMVIVATLTICAFQPRIRALAAQRSSTDYMVCLLGLLLVCYGTFMQQRMPLLFLPFLPLLALAWRHGLGGMVTGVLVLAGVSGWSAALGGGPFAYVARESNFVQLLFWQSYVAAGCLLAFSTAVALTLRHQLELRLQRSEARYRLLAEYSQDLIVRLRPDGTQSYLSPASQALLGYRPEALEDIRPLIHMDDRATVRATIAQLFAEGGSAPLLFRMRHRDGHEVWLEATARRVDAGDGPKVIFAARDVTRRVLLERELELQARFDALTGLPNRRHFEETLARSVSRTSRTGKPLMLLLLDVDRFKTINDTLGHAAGDAVLKEFGKRVRAAVFDVDLVARLGGDEFVVLVEYSAEATAGQMIASHIAAAMLPPFRIEGKELTVTTSIGIGLHFPVISALELLSLADRAMYAAKSKGRGNWELCEG
jgi:diguanylate cyclase (GGDEF)-like protein/PAS domain S-box-containing protein